MPVDLGLPAAVVALPEHEPERLRVRPGTRPSADARSPSVTVSVGVGPAGARELGAERVGCDRVALRIREQEELAHRQPGAARRTGPQLVGARTERERRVVAGHGRQRLAVERGGRRPGRRARRGTTPSTRTMSVRHVDGISAGSGGRCTPGIPASVMPDRQRDRRAVGTADRDRLHRIERDPDRATVQRLELHRSRARCRRPASPRGTSTVRVVPSSVLIAQPGRHRVPAVVAQLEVEVVERDRHRVRDLDPLAREVAAAAVPRGGGIAVERARRPRLEVREPLAGIGGDPAGVGAGDPEGQVHRRVLRRAVQVGGARQRERPRRSAPRSAATFPCRPGVVIRIASGCDAERAPERAEQVLRQARDLVHPDGVRRRARRRRSRSPRSRRRSCGAGPPRTRPCRPCWRGREDLDLELGEPLRREVDRVLAATRSIGYTCCGPPSRRTPTFVIHRPCAPVRGLLHDDVVRGDRVIELGDQAFLADRSARPTRPPTPSARSPSNAFAGRADGVKPNAGVPYVVARTDFSPRSSMTVRARSVAPGYDSSRWSSRSSRSGCSPACSV